MKIIDIVPEGPRFDFSDTIMHECICGSDLWKVIVHFENYEIATYMLDMECVYCGTRAKAPTPIDHPNYKEF